MRRLLRTLEPVRSLIALLALAWLPVAAYADDACEPLIPLQLRTLVLSKYPDYRLPRETDNLAEDIEYARKNSQSGCLGVAEADFNGDGSPDLAIGLSAKNGGGWAVVVALKRKSTWALKVLDTSKEGRNRLYVAAGRPGTYEMAGSLEGPSEKGEMKRFTCPRAPVVFGRTESSGVAYCLLKGKWKHVWFSD